jgi:phosphoribosylformimino-5-aminoimidazole carboxamide ribotide isomerase
METEGFNDVLPVMDVQGGRVVHAVRGEREHYQSVCRLGLRSDRPSDVADWYAETYGFREFYVADLDAIQSGQPRLAILRSLRAAGRTLYVDAGWSVESMAAWDFSSNVPGKVVPVVATESLQQLQTLEELFRVAPSEAVLSVDLLAGKLCSPQLQSMDPILLVQRAYESGFRRFLILDLKDVGDHGGPSSLPLVQQLRRKCPDALFWGGGGVRGPADLVRMRKSGFSRTLVATACYRGLIPPMQRRSGV